MFILRHLVTMRVMPDTLPESLNSESSILSSICSWLISSASPILSTISSTSSRAHLFSLYPLLLDLSFHPGPIPSMWIFPDEHRRLFETSPEAEEPFEELDGVSDLRIDEEPIDRLGRDAGDGGDLIEVTARDLARRCLELVGIELGISR